MGDATAPDQVVSEDTINGLPSECQPCLKADDEGDQGLCKTVKLQYCILTALWLPSHNTAGWSCR